MTTSMMHPIGYLLLRWRSLVALLGGILAAMMMLFFALSGESGAQTTTLEPGQHFIAAGGIHSLALKSDGTVYSWGDNGYGQLGLGDTKDRYTPVQITGLTGINDLGAGSIRSIALKSDGGTVWAWGNNPDGALGTGMTFTDAPVTTPKQVYEGINPEPGRYLLGVKNVDDGAAHSLAVGNDGTVWAWGDDTYCQCGYWDCCPACLITYTVDAAVPVQNLPANVSVADVVGGTHHNLALMSDGHVWAWGFNDYGQLGVHSDNKHQSPVQVHGPNNAGFLSDVKAVAAGEHHSLAVTNDGTVYAWGGNGYGQLGDGSTTDSGQTPVGGCSATDNCTPAKVVQTTDFTGLVDVAAGTHHSLALKSDGTVWAWGGNRHGQLGINTSSGEQLAPVKVKGPGGTGYLTGITEVEAGEFFNLALRNDGTVWAWGENSDGQLGDGTTHDRSYPVWTGLTGMGPAAASSPPGAPEVTEMVPVPGATGVPRMTNVTATFSEEMKTSTLTKENFRLYEISAHKRPVQITNVSVTPVNTNNGTVATLDPYGTSGKALSKDTEYVAVLTTGVENREGNAMAAPEFWRFETGRQMEG